MADGAGAQGQEPGTSTTAQGQEPGGQQQGQDTQGQEPGAGQQNGQQGGDAQPGQQPQAPDLSALPDEVRGYVESLARTAAQAAEARREAARYRTERNTLQTQHEQFRQQHETDEQRQQREQAERDEQYQALQREVQELRIVPAFTAAAQAAQALNPAALLTLVGGIGAVTLDDAGRPTNLDALIQRARTEHPYLFGRASADAGAGNAHDPGPSGPGANINSLIRGRTAKAR